MSERDRILAERENLRRHYGALFDDVASALFRADRIGLCALGAPKDEYVPEVGTILPRLGNCTSAADTMRVVHEEFTRWFGARVAGESARYEAASDEIWRLWCARGRP